MKFPVVFLLLATSCSTLPQSSIVSEAIDENRYELRSSGVNEEAVQSSLQQVAFEICSKDKNSGFEIIDTQASRSTIASEEVNAIDYPSSGVLTIECKGPIGKLPTS